MISRGFIAVALAAVLATALPAFGALTEPPAIPEAEEATAAPTPTPSTGTSDVPASSPPVEPPGLPAPTATPAHTSAPTPAPAPTPTSTSSPDPSPSPTDSTDLVPTTGAGSLTIDAPASVTPGAAVDGRVVIDVRGIRISDDRDSSSSFIATGVASAIRDDADVVVDVDRMRWQTTSITDAEGIPAVGISGGEGDLLDRVVIASTGTGGTGQSARTYLVDGVITIPVDDLPPGNYRFTFATSIS